MFLSLVVVVGSGFCSYRFFWFSFWQPEVTALRQQVIDLQMQLTAVQDALAEKDKHIGEQGKALMTMTALMADKDTPAELRDSGNATRGGGGLSTGMSSGKDTVLGLLLPVAPIAPCRNALTDAEWSTTGGAVANCCLASWTWAADGPELAGVAGAGGNKSHAL